MNARSILSWFSGKI